MLYMVELKHDPRQCPGVALDIRDRVLRMSEIRDQVMQFRGCTYKGGWVGKSSHMTFLLIDGPDAHAVDDSVVDLGFAVWNTADIYPVINLDDGVEGLRQMRGAEPAEGS